MRRFTAVTAATALAIGLGTSLICTELFLADRPLAAVGVLLLGPVIAVQSWKQQATISILHGVRRRVALLPLAATAPPAPTVVSAPPATVVPPSPAPAAFDTASKLQNIGVWTPPKTSYSSAHGRIAASVAPDPDAAFRLFAATNGFGAPDVSNVSGRRIALVGSDGLAERLSEHFTVQRLHPRLSAAELQHSRPTTLVVEEDALDGGPWAATLEPQGSPLLTELRAAQAWMRRNGGINYVLPATQKAHIAAPALRADTVILRVPLPHGDTGDVVLIDTLLQGTPSEGHS